jgi:hypothetical protein
MGTWGLTSSDATRAPADTLASGGTKAFVGPMDDALYVDVG